MIIASYKFTIIKIFLFNAQIFNEITPLFHFAQVINKHNGEIHFGCRTNDPEQKDFFIYVYNHKYHPTKTLEDLSFKELIYHLISVLKN